MPSTVDPREADLFDWGHDVVLIHGTSVTVTVAYARPRHTRLGAQVAQLNRTVRISHPRRLTPCEPDRDWLKPGLGPGVTGRSEAVNYCNEVY